MHARRNRGGGGWAGGLQAPEIVAKVDLLIIDIYREKKKIANKKKQSLSNSSKTTGNITFVRFWNHEMMELVL